MDQWLYVCGVVYAVVSVGLLGSCDDSFWLHCADGCMASPTLTFGYQIPSDSSL
jgi:hypothetical protein